MESLQEARAGRIHNRDLANVADFRDINWQHYTHPQLYDMIMTADSGRIQAQSGQWRALASAIDATTTGVRTVLANLFATWQGGAAESARASSDRLDQWAKDVTERTHSIGARVGEYSEALDVAQRRMPPPELAWAENAVDQGKPFPTLTGPSGDLLWDKIFDDRKPDFEKHHQAWQEAVRVMTDYGHQSQGVHDATPPQYPTGPAIGNGEAPAVSDPIIQRQDVVPVKDPIPGPGRPGVPGDLDGDGIPDGTTPGGYTGPGTSQGTGSGPAYGAGGPLGPGAGGGADVGRGGGPGGGGAFGGANPLAARGAGAAGGLAARGGAGGLAGARGAGGANGFSPLGAGAGARGEEDGEHKDKYTEGLDLFDDLPPAYPPVFGA